MKNPSPAVVVLSGGQDSVTCLGLARKAHAQVLAIAFDYGQRHSVELKCAADICHELNVPLKIVDISFLSALVTSALTSTGDVGAQHAKRARQLASFVPNRNALFLTIAHAYAQEVGAGYLYTGVCQTDYSGYPDCREAFILSMQYALNTGYESDVRIVTPLMHKTKAETFALAEQCGILGLVLAKSHTCYNGDRETRHAWGRGCGKCPACELRAKGWREFQEAKNG